MAYKKVAETSLYIDMQMWGVLADIMPFKRYAAFAGARCTHKISKELKQDEMKLFERNLNKHFKINIEISTRDRMHDVLRRVRRLINE